MAADDELVESRGRMHESSGCRVGRRLAGAPPDICPAPITTRHRFRQEVRRDGRLAARSRFGYACGECVGFLDGLRGRGADLRVEIHASQA